MHRVSQIAGFLDIIMSKDSSYTYVHMNQPRTADLFEEFNRPPQLPHEEIYVPPHLQPPNPEDEDDVVPDQHAAFGITRATQARKESVWKDLGLDELVKKGPTGEASIGGLGMGGKGNGHKSSGRSGLPR